MCPLMGFKFLFVPEKMIEKEREKFSSPCGV